MQFFSCFLSPVVLESHLPSFLVAPQVQDFLCYPEVGTGEQSKYENSFFIHLLGLNKTRWKHPPLSEEKSQQKTNEDNKPSSCKSKNKKSTFGLLCPVNNFIDI